MPYAKGKRTYSKKKSYRKRGASRGQVYGAAAGQLWKDVKLLKAMVNVEYKATETSTLGGAAGNVPNVLTLNGLVRGDDFNQRNGRSVKFTSIYTRMTVSANPSASPNSGNTYVRAVLFWSKDPDGALPTPLQMFGSATPNVNAMMNLNLRKDFIVLKDILFKVAPPTGAGDSTAFRKIYLKTNTHTIFNAGTTGTISDIESYSLHWFIWGSQSTSGNFPSFDVVNRLRYVDN